MTQTLLNGSHFPVKNARLESSPGGSSPVDRSRRQAGPHEQGLQIGISAHEAAEKLGRLLGVAAAENVGDKVRPRAGIEDALALETAEGIRIEYLRPLVGIVTRGVADRVREEVPKALHQGPPGRHGRDHAVLDRGANLRLEVTGEEVGGALLPQTSVRKSFIDQMQSQVQEGRGRLTIARKDTPTAQQAELLRMQVRTLQFHQRSLLAVEPDDVLSTTLRQSLETFAAGQGKAVSKLSNADIGRWIDSTRTDEYIRTTVKAGRQRRYADAVVYTARNGVADPSTARNFIDQKLRTIDQASETI